MATVTPAEILLAGSYTGSRLPTFRRPDLLVSGSFSSFKEVMNMANKICPVCDGFKLVEADNDEGLADCTECGGDGWIVTDD
ncbi:hypothetical protein ACQZM9_08080 [Streptomyces sp. P11-1]|uniref:hypothetical protein n=1 Tax=Streptomyces sp. P11-1 TaxID=3423221 RepID=UPI003D2F3A56